MMKVSRRKSMGRDETLPFGKSFSHFQRNVKRTLEERLWRDVKREPTVQRVNEGISGGTDCKHLRESEKRKWMGRSSRSVERQERDVEDLDKEKNDGVDSGSVARLRLALHSFARRELSYNYLSACNRSGSPWLRLTRLWG
uniref:Uncharacterized protein n=1 Tax=Vespula pensylvanica TaxID=30213 RepID=A0A834N2K4_VESPE|nr:hypothetical protein H0235_017005 [Vespula pensylvanica]